MKPLPVIISFLLSFTFLISCSDSETKSQTDESSIKKTTTEVIPYDGSLITVNQAIEKGYVNVTANGLGTFTKIEVSVKNLLMTPLNVEINSGLFLSNPDPKSQSLIIIEKIGVLTIPSNNTFSKITPTVCTNVNLNIPGTETGWNPIMNNQSNVDEILEAYGNHREQISSWLKEKNPSKFSTEQDQQRFLQVLVWCYTGGKYEKIVEMLAKDVYEGDISQAKQWLEGVYDYAMDITSYIKEKNYTGLVKYLELSDYIEKAKEKKERLKNKATNFINELKNK